jgi:hypothetical protein
MQKGLIPEVFLHRYSSTSKTEKPPYDLYCVGATCNQTESKKKVSL